MKMAIFGLSHVKDIMTTNKKRLSFAEQHCESDVSSVFLYKKVDLYGTAVLLEEVGKRESCEK